MFCPKVELKGITIMLNERVSGFRDFLVKMMHIENALIAEIQQN
jgi:hypothetical protein